MIDWINALDPHWFWLIVGGLLGIAEILIPGFFLEGIGQMAKHSEFVRFVLDLMEPVGEVRARAMFGGFGIYQQDTIFAIIADDRLYFKADNQIKYGRVQEAVELARTAGVRVLAAVTEPQNNALFADDKKKKN